MTNLLLAVIYAAFISLGLPDALLGSAWPIMYTRMNVPLSYAGIITFTIAMGTVISSLQSDRLTRRLGAGWVTVISVGLTALGLMGFSICTEFWMLLLFAIPYGLGAGSVDAALNNYVALHYSSRHMSWLHCMWGIGASAGPYIMGWALAGGSENWPLGYRSVGLIQIGLTLLIMLSIPLWQKRAPAADQADESAEVQPEAIPLRALVAIPGVKQVMVAFFCYCAVESTAGLWASSFLVFHHGLSEEAAAACASLFYLGMTGGRALNGFAAGRFNDTQLIRAGLCVMAVGVVVLLLPLGELAAQAGLLLFGLGCAPVYPCIIHSTPQRFGAEKSQALIGVQMASAYLGSTFMPPLFGLIANHISVGLYPVYIGLILLLLIFMEGSSTLLARGLRPFSRD